MAKTPADILSKTKKQDKKDDKDTKDKKSSKRSSLLDFIAKNKK